MSRPEDTLPPDIYYSDQTARSYTTSSRIQKIQSEMTYRALELLDLKEPSLVLDIGCGSGLSGEILSRGPDDLSTSSSSSSSPSLLADQDEPSPPSSRSTSSLNNHHNHPHHHTGPHTWIGTDISASMLALARFHRRVSGDLLLSDIGQGLSFRAGLFDAAISISCIQWLCSAPSSHPADEPARRLARFFGSLYACMRRGARGVFQFYPRDAREKTLIANAAIKAGFGAGLLEDGEGTKAGKCYLVVTVGGGDVKGVVAGMEGVDVEDARKGRVGKGKERDRRRVKGSKEWILRKREQAERKGKVVKHASRYTGRKRRVAF